MRDSSVVMALRELIKPKCTDFEATLSPMNSSWISVPTIKHSAGVPKPSNRPCARATVNSRMDAATGVIEALPFGVVKADNDQPLFLGQSP
jgi:hypothetical protein